MKNIDYSKLSEITVRTQAELDLIPLDFKGRIYVECDRREWLQIRHNYYFPVMVKGNSSVVANESSCVEAYENSTVVANENSTVWAYENSTVVANENSFVKAYGNSSVIANGNVLVVDSLQGAKIRISGNARIVF